MKRFINSKVILALFFSLLFLFLSDIDIYAQQMDISKEVKQLLEKVEPVTQNISAQGTAPKEPPRYSFTSAGYLSHLGAPPAHYFPVTTVVPGRPEVTALNFLKEHGRLFGAISGVVDFMDTKIRKKDRRNFVSFEQTYGGIPFFAGQVIVQLNELDGVEYVTSDIATDVDILDKGILQTVATISAEEAIILVRDYYNANNLGLVFTITPPQLKIYDPSIIGNSGGLRLVWDMNVFNDGSAHINDQILLDAHTGEIALKYPLNIPLLRRDIFDSNNTTTDPGTLRRSDTQNPPGSGMSGIADVDDAYNFLGHTYDFYNNQHGRDGIDGSGMTISATMRFCRIKDGILECPMQNAFWNSGWIFGRFYFGEGFAVDDVVAHEYTHAVTQFESGLIYLNQSGAINESFSDIWGEFVDLTNGAGTDTPAVKWLIGEDVGAIRSMSNPPSVGNPPSPDRMNSPLFYTGPVDNGGVHTNNGVGNKLAYLLTDGDTFNGQTVIGMGIGVVADLFYEVNSNLLNLAANYTDLYHALVQAAVNLSWTNVDRSNLYRASLSVEIADAGKDIYVDKSNGCLFPSGTLACFVGFGGPFTKVIDGVTAAYPGDRLIIKTGSFNEQIIIDKALEINAWDGIVTLGQ